jgi:thiosulfate/3-mercaptopyruvate sulfurtransferase
LAAGGSLTDETSALASTIYPPDVRGRYLVDAEQVATAIARPGVRLFDSRAPERFTGEKEPIDPVAGHIPGARSLPFADNLVNGKFRSAEQLHERFAPALNGVRPEDCIVYCGSGVTACHNLLAAAIAGLGDMRLYAGSWSEWIADPSRGVERS